MHYRGHPNWKLVGLVGGADVPPPGASLTSAGDDAAVANTAAGRITSSVFSPALKRALCLGYVRASLAIPGATFSVRDGGPSLVIIDLPVKGGPPDAK